MKGKFINTTIMMAALSGRKARKANKATTVNETVAPMADYKIIWTKSSRSEKNTAVSYRSATALIH